MKHWMHAKKANNAKNDKSRHNKNLLIKMQVHCTNTFPWTKFLHSWGAFRKGVRDEFAALYSILISIHSKKNTDKVMKKKFSLYLKMHECIFMEK
jgi:hypothetical protein